METLKKILAPTDFSELSCGGVRYAMEMARSTGVELIVFHVVDVGKEWFERRGEFGPYRDLLAEHAATLDKFLTEKFFDCLNLAEVRQVVELGVPYSNVVERARAEKVDMIVISTHGRTGLDHMLMGSVTEKIIARAPCPVLVVPRSEGGITVAAA